jgi:hypothetical protein
MMKQKQEEKQKGVGKKLERNQILKKIKINLNTSIH